jgi:hypothetical protein
MLRRMARIVCSTATSSEPSAIEPNELVSARFAAPAVGLRGIAARLPPRKYHDANAPEIVTKIVFWITCCT